MMLRKRKWGSYFSFYFLIALSYVLAQISLVKYQQVCSTDHFGG